MIKFRALIGLMSLAMLTACANVPGTVKSPSDTITRAEAKRLACPPLIIGGGASPEECACVENHLYEIGQEPGAIQSGAVSSKAGVGGEQGKRDIAIGILRLDAFEHCGLLDPEHPVAKSL